VNTGYILSAWIIVLGGLALYGAITVARGRRLSRRVPPDRRRWADTEREPRAGEQSRNR
jgi:hypothetical protein